MNEKHTVEMMVMVAISLEAAHSTSELLEGQAKLTEPQAEMLDELRHALRGAASKS